MDYRYEGNDPFATAADVYKDWNSLTGYEGSDYGMNWYGPQGGTLDQLGKIGSRIMQRGTPENMLYSGGKAAMDFLQGRRAEKDLRSMYEKAMAASDPQAGNRAFASQKWQEAISDPNTLWNRYMQQAGPEMEQEAAKYAKAGRRNMLPGMLSRARQRFMGDYVPAYAKMTDPSKFGSGAGGQVSAMFSQPLYNATRNRYAPIAKGLQDMFGSPSYKSY